MKKGKIQESHTEFCKTGDSDELLMLLLLEDELGELFEAALLSKLEVLVRLVGMLVTPPLLIVVVGFVVDKNWSTNFSCFSSIKQPKLDCLLLELVFTFVLSLLDK